MQNRKPLGLFSLTMINIIAIDNLRGLPFSATYGTALVTYYCIVAMAFFLPIALVTAELATAWPNKGGIYVWIREAFGPKWGFYIIWLQWIYNVIWYPTALSFLGGTFAYLIDPHWADSRFYMVAVVLTTFWLATLLNGFGMRLSSWVSVVGALVGTLFPMGFIIALGGVWVYHHEPIRIAFTWQALLPHLTHANQLSFLLAIVFGLVGIEMSAVHANDVEDPGKTYPRAIALSVIIILASLILSALSIAIVVPHEDLDIITGLTQGFSVFFRTYHWDRLQPVILVCILLGGLSSIAAWVIGSAKGLLVAVRDGSAPAFLGRENHAGVPTTLLFLQAIICSVLSVLFLLMPSVKSAYWVLTVITAQLALCIYLAQFAAVLKLRARYPHRPRPFCIPGGRWGLRCVAAVGMGTCLIIIGLGFLPPDQIFVGNVFIYEALLIGGMVCMSLPPFLLYAWRDRWSREEST